MAFTSYSYANITEILKDRIKNLNIPGVNDAMITTCARKAASFTGDIRTALRIFQNALEIFRDEWKLEQLQATSKRVKLNDVRFQLTND